MFAEEFHAALMQLSCKYDLLSVLSSSLNFRPIGNTVQADVGVFGMDALDIAGHGTADPCDTLGWLYMLLKYVEVWSGIEGATYPWPHQRPRAPFILCKALSPATSWNVLQLQLWQKYGKGYRHDSSSHHFFQDNSLHHTKIPSGMFNVHVRSSSGPARGQTVVL